MIVGPVTTARHPVTARVAGRTAGRAADRGSGSVLAVALLGAIVALTVLLLPVLGLLVVAGQLRTAADATALAAADTASGLLPGVPCESAQRTATLNAVELSGCEVDGLIATVTTTRVAAGFLLSARARAGPPPAEPAEPAEPAVVDSG
ncbi:hypothetical protein BJQ94_03010 [Cryobacterium sp. SO2]|uniref:Rv3654c family TadE-like protein n=1 Tax=Cryobacterium sp. SO2 TaxID=1897060 RepID=UPI00223E61CC|nr:Rv3654c family TadE-like protein [Cryobacterium sp. SO2]WEO78025.1 hypothetical protein BJQ94_03010 [Cryobacterium sp. SO2]